LYVKLHFVFHFVANSFFCTFELYHKLLIRIILELNHNLLEVSNKSSS